METASKRQGHINLPLLLGLVGCFGLSVGFYAWLAWLASPWIGRILAGADAIWR